MSGILACSCLDTSVKFIWSKNQPSDLIKVKGLGDMYEPYTKFPLVSAPVVIQVASHPSWSLLNLNSREKWASLAARAKGHLTQQTTKYLSALSTGRSNSADKHRLWPGPPQQLTLVTASQSTVSRLCWDLQAGDSANSRHTAWCRQDRGRVASPVLPSPTALRKVPRHCQPCHTKGGLPFWLTEEPLADPTLLHLTMWCSCVSSQLHSPALS